VLLALVVGLVALFGFAASRADFRIAMAVGLLLAGAALAVGALTGFVFGIPRAVLDASPVAKEVTDASSYYTVNTNLEQISDWLTKIIVGVGLTQIGSIPGKLMSLAEYTASAFGPPPVPASLVAAALVYFAIVGFLASYLWTRLLLTSEFSRADREARQSPEFLEGLVQAHLYQPSPLGFTQAIGRSQEYFRQFGDANWRVWRSLACAYAQQYSYLTATAKDKTAELQEARDNALNAVRRAVALNPQECASLRALWDPKLATPQEDDLVVFAKDVEFAVFFAQCSDAGRGGA
jgi:hypothetical protein